MFNEYWIKKYFAHKLSFLLQKDEVYLNLVLEYIPETVYKVARHYSKDEQTIPISFIKVSGFKQRHNTLCDVYVFLNVWD